MQCSTPSRSAFGLSRPARPEPAGRIPPAPARGYQLVPRAAAGDWDGWAAAEGVAPGGGGAGTQVETVAAWLARHALDPADLERQEPVWAALDEALGGRKEAVEAVRREARLLGMRPADVRRNVAVMRAMGLGARDVRASVHKCPALFLQDYESQEMQAKFLYFDQFLGKSARFVLAKQPHMLTRSLSSIHKKVTFMEARNDDTYKKTLTFIAMSGRNFCWTFGYDHAEYERWVPPQLS